MKQVILLFTLLALCLETSFAEESIADFLGRHDLTMVGDMIVPTDFVMDSNQADDEFHANYVLKRVRLWPRGEIPYVFASNITTTERNQFLSYCREMGRFARVSCRPRQSADNDFVHIEKTNENICGLSYLGRFGGRQPLKIRCWRKRTIQHELLHAFGISHEHNRMDRDDYITILWHNIDPAIRSQYNKVSIDQVALYLNYYDFRSLLHYGSYSGSANGQIVFYRNDTNGIVNQSNEMSYGDHYTLYAMYGGTQPR
jgi:hypothetical protein